MDLNDIADDKTSEEVFADFIELSTLVKKGIETCLLFYISIIVYYVNIVPKIIIIENVGNNNGISPLTLYTN